MMPITYGLMQRAETTAVFQLESRGMKELIRKLGPDRFGGHCCTRSFISARSPPIGNGR